MIFIDWYGVPRPGDRGRVAGQPRNKGWAR